MNKPDQIIIYKDEAKEWRWKLIDTGNSAVLATPNEGYKNLNHCLKMVERIFPYLTIDKIDIRD